jgi:hypothetical protein
MNVKTTTGVVAVAFGLVALCAAEAAAQAPALTVSANGSTVTISWTALPGALGYNLQAGTASGNANIASVNLPASITQVVVSAPAGTYFVAVRGIGAAGIGPFSNEGTVTVGTTPGGGGGGGGCTAPTAPTVTASTTGGIVTVNWSAVAGTVGYRLEFSRTPGGTELVQNIGANQTTYSQFVPMVGTFYVRVVAGNACGTASSAEVSFTIASQSAGSGPRTPDPPPGQLLPRPNYGESVVVALANQYRGDLINSCREHGGNNMFMFRVLQALRQRDSRWGLNVKRGNQGLSQDIVTYNPTAGPDNGAQQIYLWDMIGGHCGNSPTWNWGDVTQASWDAGARGDCSNRWCALWTIDDYLRAGFQP